MSNAEYADSLLNLINVARSENKYLELIELTPSEENSAFFTEFVVTLNAEDIQEGRSNIENVTANVKTLLSTDGPEREAMMRKYANYFSVEVFEDDGNVEAVVKIYNKHVTLDEIGPFIDGNLVLQMSSHNPQDLVPAVCKVEYAADSDESFETISMIMPWQMLYTPPDGDLSDSCMIPITVDPQYTEGSVRIVVYLCPPEGVPHKEEVDGYDPELNDMVPSVSVTRSTRSPDSYDPNDKTAENAAAAMAGLDAPLAYPSVVSIKVSSSPDWETELTQVGHQAGCIDLTKGFNEVADSGPWRFHIGISTASGGDGIEDVIFVKKEKDGEFDVPEDFEIDSTDILAGCDDGLAMNYEVCIAYKLGPNPRYSWVLPMSSEEETEKAAEAAFQHYVDHQLGGAAEVRLAPAEVNQVHGYRVALLLVYKENDLADMVFNGEGGVLPGHHVDTEESLGQKEEVDHDEAEDRENDEAGSGAGGGAGAGDGDGEGDKDGEGDGGSKHNDDMSRITGDGFSSDDFSDEEEDTFALDEQATAALQKQFQELELEKERSLTINSELQKKCCAILARIGRDSQTRGGADPDAMDPTNNTENNVEKEGHFADCVSAISDGRARLLRQQAEYDQFALDLQGRLDDKEFKAEEIMESLNEFKREIMLKAENSRTGQGISKRLIKHYEQSELKKDAELEKVRLRNISLKTTLRRLEKTLRSREQLAEGLHMIDFEQLKIENQTLSEKIEERNEELAKLKRKKTVTVQILTHIREKLRYVTTQNTVSRDDLLAVDSDINRERSILTVSKHDRDTIREDNIELKRQRGFATSDLLIIDFEKRKHTIMELTSSVEELRERYFLLTQQIDRNTRMLNKSSGPTVKSKTKTALPPI